MSEGRSAVVTGRTNGNEACAGTAKSEGTRLAGETKSVGMRPYRRNWEHKRINRRRIRDPWYDQANWGRGARGGDTESQN